ncbi:MAG: hypothetical protein GF408_03895 [Candidatus Omnitrophica bacterium]|nr:hypothetical protein [Candidatus Omnitrophota bacterium]
MAKGRTSSNKPSSAGRKAKKAAAGGGLIIGIAAVIIAVAVVGAGAYFFLGKAVMGTRTPLEFQKGMGYVTWSVDAYEQPTSDESLEKLAGTGCNYVSILVTWYQTNCWSGDIRRKANTPSDESLVHAIRKAKELGMKVMLKPHLDLLDKSDGSWRGEIGCLKESDWDKWFGKYTDFIMYYVDIAKKEDVEMFCLGTELSTAATVKGYLWKDLIAKVRKKYSGLLTYAAHWDRYRDIRFWEDLDYVGINAYFPLTEEIDPPYEDLIKGWGKWVDEIEEFQQRVDMPIIFPEIGCCSADGAAIRPWEHYPRSEVNLRIQEDYYRALFETFWEKDWFYGAYWWYWGTNVNMGGKYNRLFLLQNKPAEEVVEKWYKKPVKRDPGIFGGK